ncbi:MAG: hypothetical protein KGH53_03400 [Candidatus Micrarchaeota archaeon]|nr:hypothetical protein [Candidatus Micrarchaeota archaeon]
MGDFSKMRDSQSTTLERLSSSMDDKKRLFLQVVGSKRSTQTRIFTIEVMQKQGLIDSNVQLELAEIFKLEALRSHPNLELLGKIISSISATETLKDLQGVSQINHKAFELIEDRVKELSKITRN